LTDCTSGHSAVPNQHSSLVKVPFNGAIGCEDPGDFLFTTTSQYAFAAA
jgi:hypothetical protein